MTCQIFEMRAIQLDLARQPQNCEFIEQFIDFIARHSYNTLVLYLEGRIRTPAFHCLPENESYSPEEMRHIVAYAGERGIEIIPVVPLLGHAEMLFKYDEFEPLAELRHGRMGRFSKVKQTFCPSLPETMDFLEDYVTQIAEIFPSEYFHIGMDEVWDIGYCDLCRERLKTEGQEEIFLSHLLNCHRMITRRLGRRVMMWDDMFSLYPGLLEKIPRDIILCSWHYERTYEGQAGHIGTSPENIFRRYEQLGFSYLFAPATMSWRNVRSMTDYIAGNHLRPMGALLTAWEAETPLWRPVIAAAGELWSRGMVHFDEVLRGLLPGEDGDVAAVIRLQVENGKVLFLPGNPEEYLKGILSDSEYMAELENFLCLRILERRSPSPVTEAAWIQLKKMEIYFALRKLLPRWFGVPGCGGQSGSPSSDDEMELRRLLEEERRQVELLQEQQHMLGERTGVRPGIIEKLGDLRPVATMLEQLPANPRPPQEDFLWLRIPWTPDHLFSAKISLRLRGEKDFRRIWDGSCFQRVVPGEFQQFMPFHCLGVPEELRIEIADYVGCALSCVRILCGQRQYEAYAVRETSGRVLSPEALFGDGRDWAFFGDGEQQAYRKYLDSSQALQIHGVRLMLREREAFSPQSPGHGE